MARRQREERALAVAGRAATRLAPVLQNSPISQGEPVNMSALSDRIGYNLRRTYAAVLANLSTALEQFDIRPKQYGILVTVGRNPGLKQTQVGEALGIARTNLVPMLDALEQRGLIERRASETDRRSYALYLTESGVALTSRLRKIDADHEAKMHGLLGAEDGVLLISLLQKLRAAIAESHGAERPAPPAT